MPSGGPTACTSTSVTLVPPNRTRVEIVGANSGWTMSVPASGRREYTAIPRELSRRHRHSVAVTAVEPGFVEDVEPSVGDFLQQHDVGVGPHQLALPDRALVGFENRTFALSTRRRGASRVAAEIACGRPMLGTTVRIWNTTTAVATIASAYLRKHHAADAIAYSGEVQPERLRVQHGERPDTVERDEPQHDQADEREHDEPHGRQQEIAERAPARDLDRASVRTATAWSLTAPGTRTATTPPPGGQ